MTAYQAMRREAGQGTSVAKSVTSFVNAVKVGTMGSACFQSCDVVGFAVHRFTPPFPSLALPSRSALILILAVSSPINALACRSSLPVAPSPHHLTL
jgi:hypothetical protein